MGVCLPPAFVVPFFAVKFEHVVFSFDCRTLKCSDKKTQRQQLWQYDVTCCEFDGLILQCQQLCYGLETH